MVINMVIDTHLSVLNSCNHLLLRNFSKSSNKCFRGISHHQKKIPQNGPATPPKSSNHQNNSKKFYARYDSSLSFSWHGGIQTKCETIPKYDLKEKARTNCFSSFFNNQVSSKNTFGKCCGKTVEQFLANRDIFPKLLLNILKITGSKG